MAMLDTATLEPATLKKKVVSTMMWFRINFNPLNGDVRVSDSAAAVLKKLRLEGEKAQFATSREFDAKIKPLKRAEPLFPRISQVKAETGKTLHRVLYR
jgi:hypothetical protein